MTTVDQFLDALAMVESSNNPQAWGDGGRAMGRWQVHSDRLWSECAKYKIAPQLGETWDSLVRRVLIRIFNGEGFYSPAARIAMYWHLGHWCGELDKDWDAAYADKFNAALARAIGGAGE
jgi:hypothetical protein